MERPRVVVPIKRRVGRPRSVSSDAAAVHLLLDPDDYDYAFKVAKKQHVTVPEVIRRAFKEWRAARRS